MDASWKNGQGYNTSNFLIYKAEFNLKKIINLYIHFKVITHIGANSIREVKELAVHAERVGVDAIAILPPFFYKAEVKIILKVSFFKIRNLKFIEP